MSILRKKVVAQKSRTRHGQVLAPCATLGDCRVQSRHVAKQEDAGEVEAQEGAER